MAKRLIEVQVRVTSVVTYRLPRPTKAEVIDAMGDPEAWDKDDPLYSIQEYFESEGLDDILQGYRPVGVDVEDIEIDSVDEPRKGAKPSDANQKMVKIRGKYKCPNGSWHWLWWGRGNDWMSHKNTTYGDDTHTLSQLMSESRARNVIKNIRQGAVRLKFTPDTIEMVPSDWRPTPEDPLSGTE